MTETAKMYGGSFYDLAAEEGLEDQLFEELDAAVKLLWENPDYLHLLSLPNVPKKERCGLLAEAFGSSVHPYLLSFMQLLCEKGTIRELRGCAQEYRVRYNEAHGIVEATAVSAVALSDADRTRLQDKLCAMTGKQVRLTTKVDPAVLGGIRLDMEGTRMDGTVQNRLDAISREIAGAAL